jgi:hypothetical protein
VIQNQGPNRFRLNLNQTRKRLNLRIFQISLGPKLYSPPSLGPQLTHYLQLAQLHPLLAIPNPTTPSSPLGRTSPVPPVCAGATAAASPCSANHPHLRPHLPVLGVDSFVLCACHRHLIHSKETFNRSKTERTENQIYIIFAMNS